MFPRSNFDVPQCAQQSSADSPRVLLAKQILQMRRCNYSEEECQELTNRIIRIAPEPFQAFMRIAQGEQLDCPGTFLVATPDEIAAFSQHRLVKSRFSDFISTNRDQVQRSGTSIPANLQDVYYLMLGDCPESFEYFCARVSEAVSDGRFEAVLAQPLPLLPNVGSAPLNSAKTKECEIAEVRDMYALLRTGVQADRKTVKLTKEQVE